MKLQKDRKSSDDIHNTVYSKMKLLQPNKIGPIKSLIKTLSNKSFYSDATSFLQ